MCRNKTKVKLSTIGAEVTMIFAFSGQWAVGASYDLPNL